jgi:HSP20 family protein
MKRDSTKKPEESQAMEPRRQDEGSRMESWGASSPFGLMRRFFDDIDRMVEGFGFPTFEHFSPWSGPEAFSARVDMFVRDGKLVITADLPGMSKDDVKVDIADEALVIEGERKYEHQDRKEGLYRSERSHGRFRRQIPLPPGVKTDSATASFKNGVLEISMDAPQLVKSSRRIQIQDEGTGHKAA